MSFQQVVSSDPFRFLVGERQKQYSIHAVLVARQSPVLEKMVNNGMAESRSKTAVWNDIDDDTFSYFAEFAYTGDYNACPAVGVSTMLELGGNAGPGLGLVNGKPEGDDMSSDGFVSRPKKAKKNGKTVYPSKRDALWAAFVRERPFNCPEAHHLPSKQGSTIDLTGTLLTHAKLYVFADRYEIIELMKLSLVYLHDALIHINAFSFVL